MKIHFYPDQVYKKANSKEEQDAIRAKAFKCKRENKPIPSDLLNPKATAIYLNVRIGREFQYKMNTKEFVMVKYWNFDSQQVKHSYTGAPELNERLNSLRADLQRNYRVLLQEKETITTHDIKNLVSTLFEDKKPRDTRKEFIEAINQFIEVKSADKGALTIKKYKTLSNLLQGFQEDKKYQLYFESINVNFYELFKAYLIKDKKQTNNTIGKYISTLKTFLHWATDREYNKNLTFKKFKVPNENSDIIYLTEEELFHLYNFDLAGKKVLESVRDTFCFGCFTGARFSDIFKLRREDIKDNIWHLRTVKTREKIQIPLNEFALEILAKYSNVENPLPVMSNQKTNLYLKLLGKYLDINEDTTKTMYRGAEAVVLNKPKHDFISTHTARRTFVTLSLEKGMRAETVMAITGHKDYKTMKKYLKIISKVKEQEMNNVWSRQKL